jgi:methionine synthase I (cobalamin-dependent)
MSNVVILDGAWGTELQARGLTAGDCPDEWNISHPDAVISVASAYANAGSRIILTNTFRSNRIALSDYGFADRVVQFNAEGVALSKTGAGGQAQVFGSVGPSGKVMAAGEVTADQLRAAFEEQIKAMADAKVDGIVIETMSDPEEAVIAVAAARETGLPVVASMAYDTGKKKDRTMTGATPERAAEMLAEAGADIVGANCGCGIELYVDICRRLHSATSKPIWIKANAGLPEVVGGKTRYTMTAGEFGHYAKALEEAGASYIGGCCGTNPDFIRALCGVLSGEN